MNRKTEAFTYDEKLYLVYQELEKLKEELASLGDRLDKLLLNEENKAT